MDPLDEVLDLMDSFPPDRRVRLLTALLDARNTKGLGDVRARTIYDLTRAEGATYVTVATDLGMGVKAVERAVGRHNRNRRSAP